MSRTVGVPLWLIVLVGAAVIILGLIVWSVKRRKRPHLSFESIDSIGELMRSVAGVTQSTVLSGNSVRLLENGRFFDDVFPTIENARASVNVETFLSKDGEVTRRMAEALSRKARAGVKVRLMLDGSGGREFGKESIRQMKEAGCRVVFYHPLELRNLGRINTRTHRKIIVVDGRIGYVGGHCLVDSWLGNAESKEHFRDISARVEGPVVAQLQSAFADNWIEETGEVIDGDRFFPPLPPAGGCDAHVVFVSPTGAPSTLKLLHYIGIQAAKKSILIQNPYFLPDPDARDALVAAVKRGVDVRIMIPDTSASDSQIVQHASHHHYGTLLKGGVRLFDYMPTLLHQKVFTVDGTWSSIGSTNFDDRSFEINDEVSLVVYDTGMAAQLEAIFRQDREHAVERHLESWRRRPILHKLIDFTAFLANEQL
ncbi:MAG TPA: phospholipase D-like domain-containing protein [Thermoanaerobaculia bacterium]|nr:phospholipase D-like domain-containing protein [Thermoanaerobaculia bacterium]